VKLKGTSQNFYEIGPEILTCLSAGGIVMALLGPVAVNERNMGGTDFQEHTLALKKKGVASYDDKYKGDYETSYDWLDQGFLQDTKLDALHKKYSTNISVLSGWTESKQYFREVTRYWMPIQGPELYKSSVQATLTYRIEEPHRWGMSGSVSQHDVWILAVAEHTGEPIAIATNYLHQRGLLVLVPPFDIEPVYTSINAAQSPVTAKLLVDFANSIREKIQGLECPDIPDWAKEHRAPNSVEIASRIEKHEAELDSLRGALARYDEMLYLLSAKGELLEQQVCRVFSVPGEEIRAEPTPKGSLLDLFVTDKSGRSLAIEITGTRGKLTLSDKHWADFLNYLPEHNEKNQNGRVERIVLIVNTQNELPLEKRTRKEDITDPVIRTATDNHICIVRSCDLYQLWMQTLGGLPVQKIFDGLFGCEGIYDFDKIKKFI
jgi:hypothetical protein